MMNELIKKDILYREVEYTVTVGTATSPQDVLIIEVEEKNTGDLWGRSFSASDIETTTAKIGNSKKFNVFVKMLVTGLMESGETVKCSLLSYDDLQSLRRNITKSTRDNNNNNNNNNSASMLDNTNFANKNKMYLIMTYDVEFDKVHYPLALPFRDITDPTELKEKIRALRFSQQQLAKEKSLLEIRCKELENALNSQGKDIDSLQKKVLSFESGGNSGKNASQEMEELKNTIKRINEELQEEHANHRRMMLSKNREIREMSEEVERLKDSEKNLNLALKNTKQELELAKVNGRSSSRTSSSRPTTLSSNKGGGRFDPTAYVKEKQKQQRTPSTERSRPGSSERPNSASKTRLSDRPNSRSNSTERGRTPARVSKVERGRSSSRENSRTRSVERSRPSSADKRTASPALKKRPTTSTSEQSRGRPSSSNERTRPPSRPLTSSSTSTSTAHRHIPPSSNTNTNHNNHSKPYKSIPSYTHNQIDSNSTNNSDYYYQPHTQPRYSPRIQYEPPKTHTHNHSVSRPPLLRERRESYYGDTEEDESSNNIWQPSTSVDKSKRRSSSSSQHNAQNSGPEVILESLQNFVKSHQRIRNMKEVEHDSDE